MTTIDLTGDWEGHYVQNNGRHGISMRVVQRGQSFVGAMRDADTLLSSRQELHAPAGSDGKRKELLGEVEVLSTLPEHSTIEGEVEGRVVTFVKSYRGNSTTSVWGPGGAKVHVETPGHQVHYRGTLDVRGDECAGHWSIPSLEGGRPIRDRFLLRRVRSSPPA